MFSNLFKYKMKFDFENLEISIKTPEGYRELDLEKDLGIYTRSYLDRIYSNWEKTLDRLAYQYKISNGRKHKDVPVEVHEDLIEGFIFQSDREYARINFNTYLILGMKLSYIKWKWGKKFYHQLDNVVIYKSMFKK